MPVGVVILSESNVSGIQIKLLITPLRKDEAVVWSRLRGQQGMFVAFVTESQWERIQSVGEDLIQYATGRVSAGAASQAKSLISAVII